MGGDFHLSNKRETDESDNVVEKMASMSEQQMNHDRCDPDCLLRVKRELTVAMELAPGQGHPIQHSIGSILRV